VQQERTSDDDDGSELGNGGELDHDNLGTFADGV
jgi:hypothetical protein